MVQESAYLVGCRINGVNYGTLDTLGENQAIPSKYILYQNYPNPFNPATNISFSIPEKLFVTLKVYNILGKEVANLINGYREKRNYSVRFDRSRLSSGTYIHKLTAGYKTIVKKMLLIKQIITVNT